MSFPRPQLRQQEVIVLEIAEQVAAVALGTIDCRVQLAEEEERTPFLFFSQGI